MSRDDPFPSASGPVADSGELAAEGDGVEVVATGRYVEGALLGRGGMGEVRWLRDGLLQRDVARKVLRATSAHAEARLLREARLTARLEHPGIVPVYDAGRDEEGRLFFTMRVVRGQTLARAFAEHPPPRLEGPWLRHFLDACEAVAYAHSVGVVHRDLKPSNILVGAFGETQVADWGLAAWLDEDVVPTDASGPPPGPGLTRDGAVVGTPAYMSPEQARGERATPASDVWALGAVLYELLGGNPPHGRGTSSEVLERLQEPEPPSALPGVPPDLWALVERALQPEAGARYPSAFELAEDLARWIDGRPVHAYVYSPWELLARTARAWRAPMVVGGVASIALLVGAAVAWQRTAAERDRALAAEAVAVEARVAADRSHAASLVQQAQNALDDGEHALSERLAVQALGLDASPEALGVLVSWAGQPRPERGASWNLPPDCRNPRFGVDASVVLCTGGEGVRVATAEGPVHDFPGARSVGWPGDGSALVGDGQTLLWLGPDGVERGRHGTTHATSLEARPGSPEAMSLIRSNLVHHDPRRGESVEYEVCDVPGQLAWRHDGLLAVACESREVFVGPPDALERWSTLPTSAHLASLAWTPDDGLVAGTLKGDVVRFAPDGSVLGMFSAGSSAVVAVDEVDGRVAALDVLRHVSVWSTEGLPLTRLPPGLARDLRWEDGRLWVLDDEQARPWVIGPGVGRGVHPGSEGVSSVAMSRDGQRMACARGDGTVELFGRDGATAHRTLGDRVVKDVAFARDGSVVAAAFLGDHGIHLLDPVNGSTVARWPSPRLVSRVAWLADGRLVATPFKEVVYVMDGTGVVEVPGVFAVDLEASPDGRSLGLLGRYGRLVRFDGETHAILGDDDEATAVAALDDGGLLVARPGEVLRLDRQGRRVDRLVGARETYLDVQVSPDGRYVLASSLDGWVSAWALDGDGTPVARWSGFEERVASLAVGPDGRVLAGSWDHTCRLADLSVLDEAPAELAEDVAAAWGPTSR